MERMMAQRLKQPTTTSVGKAFPPEADGEFDVVKTSDIAAWREKLNKRFGIGDGRMKSLDVLTVE
jgi:hypothetical protein